MLPPKRKGHSREINIRDTDTPLGLRRRSSARDEICRSVSGGDGCIIACSLDLVGVFNNLSLTLCRVNVPCQPTVLQYYRYHYTSTSTSRFSAVAPLDSSGER
jgi:hypothetical protein